MRGVAEQRDAAVRPARQRIAVAHRIFPELRRRLDQRLGVDERNAEALHMRHQIFEPAGARPVFLARRHAAFADLHQHRPVGQRAVGARAFADRIDHELRRHAAGDHHRAAGEELRPVDRAAPQHRAVPARRAFVGIERLAHVRVDAVGADQHVAAHAAAVAAVAVEEIRGDAAFVLRERAEPMAGVDAGLAEPRAHRLVDHALQPAAMDRELRHVVAGIECRAARARSPGRTGWCRSARRCGCRPRRAGPAARAPPAP